MPAFLMLLLTSVASWFMKNLLPQMLLSIGVGLISYTGFSALSNNLSTAISDMSQMAASTNTLFHMFGVYQGIQVLLSCISIKASLAITNRFYFTKVSS